MYKDHNTTTKTNTNSSDHPSSHMTGLLQLPRREGNETKSNNHTTGITPPPPTNAAPTTTNTPMNNSNNQSTPLLKRNDDHNAATLPPTLPTQNNTDNTLLATIIVQLRGEMGNQLSVWSYAKTVQFKLLEDFGISAELIPRHQVAGKNRMEGTIVIVKAKRAYENIQQCFPNIRPMYDQQHPFEGVGNSDYFSRRYQQQKSWLFPSTTTTTTNTPTTSSILQQQIQEWGHDLSDFSPKAAGLKAFVQLLRLPSNNSTQKPPTILRRFRHAGTNSTFTEDDPASAPMVVDTISMPFLYISSFQVDLGQNHTNRSLDEMRSFFAFNDTACCASLPEPDETVFVRTS
jgi:hypothetical protein